LITLISAQVLPILCNRRCLLQGKLGSSGTTWAIGEMIVVGSARVLGAGHTRGERSRLCPNVKNSDHVSTRPLGPRLEERENRDAIRMIDDKA
jgi:hypothetical protein